MVKTISLSKRQTSWFYERSKLFSPNFQRWSQTTSSIHNRKCDKNVIKMQYISHIWVLCSTSSELFIIFRLAYWINSLVLLCFSRRQILTRIIENCVCACITNSSVTMFAKLRTQAVYYIYALFAFLYREHRRQHSTSKVQTLLNFSNVILKYSCKNKKFFRSEYRITFVIWKIGWFFFFLLDSQSASKNFLIKFGSEKRAAETKLAKSQRMMEF